MQQYKINNFVYLNKGFIFFKSIKCIKLDIPKIKQINNTNKLKSLVSKFKINK